MSWIKVEADNAAIDCKSLAGIDVGFYTDPKYPISKYHLLLLTLLPMARGFVYLVAVLDWYSRKVLSWKVSITMDVDFCLEAVEEATAHCGIPEIMNADRGSQFTSQAFTGLLKDHGVRISMDGKGSWRDNVFIERLWRSVKYEEVYLHAYDTVSDS